MSARSVPDGTIAYYHDSFRKEEQDLLRTMTATKKKAAPTSSPSPIAPEDGALTGLTALAQAPEFQMGQPNHVQGPEVGVRALLRGFMAQQQSSDITLQPSQQGLLTGSQQLHHSLVNAQLPSDASTTSPLVARAVASAPSVSGLLSSPLRNQTTNTSALLASLVLQQNAGILGSQAGLNQLLEFERQKREANVLRTLELLAQLRR